MPRNADPRIVGQHSLEAKSHLGRAIRYNHLPRMQRITDADASTVMKRNPPCAAGGIHQSVENRPVGARVAAVAHALRFPERRRDGPCIEMISPDHYRS